MVTARLQFMGGLSSAPRSTSLILSAGASWGFHGAEVGEAAGNLGTEGPNLFLEEVDMGQLDRQQLTVVGAHDPRQRLLQQWELRAHPASYQRRAQHVGQCGVEVGGGRLPTADRFLNLQILTSGGF
jgi:hypothetical protein